MRECCEKFEFYVQHHQRAALTMTRGERWRKTGNKNWKTNKFVVSNFSQNLIYDRDSRYGSLRIVTQANMQQCGNVWRWIRNRKNKNIFSRATRAHHHNTEQKKKLKKLNLIKNSCLFWDEMKNENEKTSWKYFSFVSATRHDDAVSVLKSFWNSKRGVVSWTQLPPSADPNNKNETCLKIANAIEIVKTLMNFPFSSRQLILASISVHQHHARLLRQNSRENRVNCE